MARLLPIARATACATLCAWCCCAGILQAHEVDQYDIPAGQVLVDHGDYWNDLLYGAVQRAVAKTNRELDEVKRVVPGLRQVRQAQLVSLSALTKRVRGELPGSMMAVTGLEFKLHYFSPKPAQANHVHAHFSSRWSGTYGALPYWPDPRIWNRMSFLRCSTVKFHGHYLGIDKVSHFVGMGGIYYTYYQYARMAGETQAEAVATAVKLGRYGPISENWLVGGIPTGIYSSADMAANYSGLKFYLNVTEPVAIAGQVRPPMVVFDGEHFQIQPHVRPEYFAIFLSRHWDEVLNPCLYEWTFRDNIRQRIVSRREAILARYAGDDPARRTPEYFDAVLADCLTWYGEEYGHSGQLDKLITVSRVCFDQPTSDDLALREAGLAAAFLESVPLGTGEVIAVQACERLPSIEVEQAAYAEEFPCASPPDAPDFAPALEAIREGRRGP